MPAPYLQLVRLFVISSEDITEELDKLQRTINQLNESHSPVASSGYRYEIVGRDYVTPGQGRPLELILQEFPIDTWDIFIAIIWLKFGKPSGGKDIETDQPYASNIEELYKRAYAHWKQHSKRPVIWLYRCTKTPQSTTDIDTVELAKINEFFKFIDREILNIEYKTSNEFKEVVQRDLLKFITDLSKTPSIDSQQSSTTFDNKQLQQIYLDNFRKRNNFYEKYEMDVEVHAALTDLYIKPFFARNRSFLSRNPGILPQSLPTEEILLRQRRPRDPNPHSFDDLLAELLNENRCLVLIGEAGMGKTTLLKVIGVQCADLGEQLPVFIQLTDYALYVQEKMRRGAQPDLVEFLTEHVFKHFFSRISMEEVARGLRGNTFFLLLDALDEISSPYLRNRVINSLDIALSSSACNAILSSRSASYRYELSLPHWPIRELQPLTPEQIREYIQKWTIQYPHLEELGIELDYNLRLANLMSTPLLLHLMVVQLGEAPLEQFREFPDNRIALYERFVRHLLEERPNKRYLRSPEAANQSLSPGLADKDGSRSLAIKPYRRREILEQIAYQFHDAGYWYADESIVISHIRDIGQHQYLSSDTVGNELEYLAEETGLIRKDNKKYTFSHFTFQEFFTAEHLSHQTDQASLIKRLLEKSMNPWWHEAIIIYFATSKNQSWLATLLDADDNIFATRTFLAVNCLSVTGLANIALHDLYQTLHRRLVGLYLYSPYVRRQSLAQDAIQTLGGPSLVAFWAEELRQTDRRRRRHAIQALGELGSNEAIELLVAQYHHLGFEPDLLLALMDALIGANKSEVNEIILDILGDDRRLAPRIISQLLDASRDNHINTLLTLLDERQMPDWLRQQIIAGLGTVDHPHVREKFMQMLAAQPSDQQRGSLLDAVAFPANEHIRVYALNLLNTQEVDLIRVGVRFLGRQQDATVIDQLINLLLNLQNQEELQRDILRALGAIGQSEAEGYLNLYLREIHSPRLLQSGVEALGQCGRAESFQFLEERFALLMVDKTREMTLKGIFLESLAQISQRLSDRREHSRLVQHVLNHLQSMSIKTESTLRAAVSLIFCFGSDAQLATLLAIARWQALIASAIITYLDDPNVAQRLPGDVCGLLDQCISTADDRTAELAFRLKIRKFLTSIETEAMLRKTITESRLALRLIAMELASTSFKQEDMQELLLPLLTDDDPAIVEWTIKLLGESGDEVAVTPLLDLLHSSHQQQIYISLFAIASRYQLLGIQSFRRSPDDYIR